MNDVVTIYQPLDKDKLRRLLLLTRNFPGSLTPVYETDTGPNDDYFDALYVLKDKGIDVQVRALDIEEARKLSEFIAAMINCRDELLVFAAAMVFPQPPRVRQPSDTTLERVTEEVATAPGGDRELDDHIHDALGIEATFPRDYSANFESALGVVMNALPGWGYKLSCGPAPMNRIVATLMRPPLNPDGAIDDGTSWGKHYDGTGANNALALLHAFFLAIKENPLVRE